MRLDLAPTVHAPAQARDAVAALDLAAEDAFRLGVVLSELVTNCVRHGHLGDGDRIRVEVDVDPVVHGLVSDPGGGQPRQRAEGPDGGYGLHLVERLSERWGVVTNEETKVWFELAA